MPFITINVAKPVDASLKNALQLEIGGIMETIPGKNIGNTVFCINDNLTMFKNGQPYVGIFTEVRLFKVSPEESKKAFAEKLYPIFEKIVGIAPAYVSINFVEMEHWASNGGYN